MGSQEIVGEEREGDRGRRGEEVMRESYQKEGKKRRKKEGNNSNLNNLKGKGS